MLFNAIDAKKNAKNLGEKDPLHLMAAEALVSWHATVVRLQERVRQLEAIARLNGETIRAMQRAAAEAGSAEYRVSTRNGDFHARR